MSLWGSTSASDGNLGSAAFLGTRIPFSWTSSSLRGALDLHSHVTAVNIDARVSGILVPTTAETNNPRSLTRLVSCGSYGSRLSLFASAYTSLPKPSVMKSTSMWWASTKSIFCPERMFSM